MLRKILQIAAAVLLTVDSAHAYNAVVSPTSVICTNFQGWGTSLCWWANVIGNYPNRTNYVNLAFSTLKLNIVRYNIGAGQNPTNTATPSQGYRAIMQGFEPSPGIWNWNADTNQRWVLQQAEARGASLVDAFANSPPWWMCVNSNCDGNASATNNLQVNNETNFAVYLATVVSNLTVLDGDHFNYLTPMNEPNGTAWTGTSQEGCDMSPGQQGTVVGILHTQLNTIAPSVSIDAAEDVDPYQTWNDLTSYNSTQLGDVALLTTHTYGFNGAAALQSEAASKGKPLWVSEYGDGDGSGLTMARYIYNDIDVMGAQAWVYWQVVDSASGWGFLLNSLLATNNASYTSNYTINEKFYVMGQFSEFVRPGCNIISVNDTNTLAAYNSTNATLTLVMVNNTSSSQNVTYNLGAFSSLPAQVAVYQTSSSENLTNLSPLAVSGGQFSCTNPPDSVTTFFLTNVANAPTLTSGGTFPATNYITLYSGESASLSVSAQGNTPLYYQWYSNGAAIGGAIGTAYIPPAGSQNSTNFYFCIVTNIAGSVTSAVWSVSILPQPIASYPQTVLGLHPIGYWRLDETPNNGSGNQGVVCHDYAAGNNGVYSNVVLSQSGYNPVTDPMETSTFFGTYASSNSDAGQIANIDFSTPAGNNAEYSISAWVDGTYYAQTANAGIVTKGYLGGEELNLDEGAPGSDFRFEVQSATGTSYSANSTINAYNNGTWHHLVGVCDEANNNVLLYVDGALAGQASIPALSGITNASSVPMTIGSRASSAASGNNLQFLGKIDDVAIFNYALSSNQVQQLYASSAIPAMSAALSGNNLVITYTGTLLSSTNVLGPYKPVSGATLSSYSVSTTNSAMFFRTSTQQ